MNYEQLAAARDPNTPVKSLELLATDKYPYVRSWVALNPNTPVKSLELLATDKSFNVRYWVTKHPNCNQIIERLVLMTDYRLSTDHENRQ
jgi:hypothetical protein